MKILVVGSGGREHALAWRLGADSPRQQVTCAPGNPGTAACARNVAIDATDIDGLLAFARAERPDLTVVGPEAPLAAGIADAFDREGLPLVGASRAAAQLETSKVFAKAFMARHGIPTARYRACDTVAQANAAIAELGVPVVVKADGLAAGKGVVVATDVQAAHDAVDDAMLEGRFGDAGRRLVVEECLVGEEASFFVVSDGRSVVPLGSAQDHKRAYDNDEGPNTGGMGAFAPTPAVTAAIEARVLREIVEPLVAGMHDEGMPYRGFLYVGLMLTADGPKVIEFNVRFGDPEAQVVLPALQGDLSELLLAVARRDVASAPRPSMGQPHVGVVLASEGYPGAFERGRIISGVADAARLTDVLVFHAGTALRDGALVTAGGRVLTVVGRGLDFPAAISRAYEGVDAITFTGRHVRRDIGRRALVPRV